MKLLTAAALAVSAVSLTACAGLPTKDVGPLLTKLTTDPACGHHDDLTFGAGTLGGVTVSGHVARDCPTPAPKVKGEVAVP